MNIYDKALARRTTFDKLKSWLWHIAVESHTKRKCLTCALQFMSAMLEHNKNRKPFVKKTPDEIMQEILKKVTVVNHPKDYPSIQEFIDSL